MAWWVWLVVALSALLLLALAAFWAIRRNPLGAAFLDLDTVAKLRFVKAWVTDRQAGWRLRALVAFVTLYLLSPIDIVPDFIPFIGQLDDIIVIGLFFFLLLRFVPRTRVEAALVAAKRIPGSRTAPRP
ncbi:MAG: YkvA family protein [Dehalococcoidia bacterium]